MTHVLTIASRELVEKRFVFLAAIGFAIISVLVPFVPGVHTNPRDTIALGSVILATGFALGLAAMLGSSIVGREISTGRMSFYFARPVGATAIWFGKLAGALILVCGSFAIVLLPALIAQPPIRWAWTGDVGTTLLTLGAVAATLFFLLHAVGTMARSHSALIGVDFVAAALTIGAAWLVIRPILEEDGGDALRFMLVAMGVLTLIVMVVAGAWQLADGRSDRRRSHTAFSKALWSGIAVVLLLGGAFTAWLVSPSFRDLDTRRLYAEQAPQGEWAVIGGEVPHHFDVIPKFIVNLRTGEATRLRAHSRPAFSPDGTKLVTFGSMQPFSPRANVVVRDLRSGRETDTSLIVNRFTTALVPNDDASRLVLIEAGLVSVYDVAAKRTLMSARVGWPRAIFFASNDVVRFYLIRSNPWLLDAYELNVPQRAIAKTGERALDWPAAIRANREGTRIILSDSARRHYPLVDARTLQTIETVDATSFPKYLTDGRLVYTVVDGGHLTLHVDGKTIDVGAGNLGGIGSEVAPGKVVVYALGKGPRTAILVDVDRDTVIRRIDGVIPSVGYWFDPRPSNNGPDMLLETKSSLVRWNALTGETKTLIPSS